MIEVYRNTSEYVGLSVYVSGVLTDATADAVTATLKDNMGVVLNVQSAVKKSTGKYQYLIPLSYTTYDRNLTVEWGFSILGETAIRRDAVSVVTPYVSVDEIYTSYPQLAGKTYAEVKDMERRVRMIIDTVTSQSFGNFKDSLSFYGTGEDFIYFNRRLVSIDGFAANGISSTLPLPFKITNGGWGFRVDTGQGFNINPYYNYNIKNDIIYGQGTFPGNYSGGGFFASGVYYTLSGMFGWESVPNDVNMCAKMLVGDYFCPQDAWRTKGVKSTSAADWTFEFYDHQGTGNTDVDKILSSYAVPNLVVF